MHSVITLSVAAFAGFCAAQTTAQASYPYTINPSSVSLSDRQYWCAQNEAECPLICLQQPGVSSETTESNTCDPDTLTYSCVCANGVSPNITQYSQTLPYFICQAWGTQCVAACGSGDNTCQNACRADHPCGAQSPYLGNSSLISTMSSTQAPTGTAKTSVVVTGFGGQTGSSTPSKKGAAAPGTFIPGAALSMAAVVGSAFLGFAILL